MTKGKYAARAANREAARDNELIASQADRIRELQAELAQLRAELHQEKAERGGLIVAQADRLSAQQIATLRQENAQAWDEHYRQLIWVAEWLMRFFHLNDSYPEGFVDQVLPHLVPDTVERNLIVDSQLDQDEFPTNRNLRRHSAENVERSSRRFRHKDSGAALLERKRRVAELTKSFQERGGKVT